MNKSELFGIFGMSVSGGLLAFWQELWLYNQGYVKLI